MILEVCESHHNMSINLQENNQVQLEKQGFRLNSAGVHTARTIMLEELETLFTHVDNPGAVKKDYQQTVIADNCLGKKSGKSRSITYSHLLSLYGLDRNVLIFRTMLYFWNRDPDSRSLLALLCAYCRDSILRLSFEFIRRHKTGQRIHRENLEEFIEKRYPERFSQATRTSLAQNLNSSWTKSGHLKGGTKKYRTRAKASSGSVCYALFLGYLTGLRGQALFKSAFCKLLDLSFDEIVEFAHEGARRGWIVFKRIGDVLEVNFPALISDKEIG